MRAPKFCFLVLSFFLFVQCSKDNPPEPESQSPKETPEEPTSTPEPEPIVYFTFTIDTGFDTSERDNWILIHDENGKLLDYKAYESGATLEFKELESNLTEYIHISLFYQEIYHFVDGNDHIPGDRYLGTTYPRIPLKSHWTQDYHSTTFGQKIELTKTSDFTLTLLNFPGYDNILNSYFIGTKIGNLSTFGAPYISASSAYHNSTSTLELNGVANFEENPEYLWTFFDKENFELKYTFFEDPEDGLDIELDYNNFAPFDNVYYLPVFPDNQGYNFVQVGYEDEANFKSSSGHYSLVIRSSPDLGGNGIPIGSLDRFKYYRTELNYSTEEYTYSMNQYGPLMSIESYPENPEITTNGTIQSFEISSNIEYIRREDSWVGTNKSAGDFNATEWKVVCDDATYPNLSEFPEELLTLYPALAPLDELERNSTYLHLQGDTYRQNLNRLFDPSFDHMVLNGFINEYLFFPKQTP